MPRPAIGDQRSVIRDRMAKALERPVAKICLSPRRREGRAVRRGLSHAPDDVQTARPPRHGTESQIPSSQCQRTSSPVTQMTGKTCLVSWVARPSKRDALKRLCSSSAFASSSACVPACKSPPGARSRGARSRGAR
jgi:hypothetical protein